MSTARCGTRSAERYLWHMRARRLALILVAGCLGPWIPEASALGMSVSAPVGSLTPFAPGSTGTTSGALTVVSLTPWTIQVADQSGSAAPGHLIRSASCSQGAASLAQPLAITATPAPGTGTSSGQKTLSSATQSVATGPAGTSVVTTAYSQTIGTSEVLLKDCAYSVTVTYTAS
jgi:hypothetical protein